MTAPEPWLRGPLPGVDPWTMPVAHALLQAREDLAKAAAGLTTEQLWARPGGAASVGFHLRHLAGSARRLLAYAEGRQLRPDEIEAMRAEGEPGDPPMTADACIAVAHAGIDFALETVRAARHETLLEAREVGRARLPSNVLGLLFHVAEHTQRHVGAIVATAKVVRESAVDRRPSTLDRH